MAVAVAVAVGVGVVVTVVVAVAMVVMVVVAVEVVVVVVVVVMAVVMVVVMVMRVVVRVAHGRDGCHGRVGGCSCMLWMTQNGAHEAKICMCKRWGLLWRRRSKTTIHDIKEGVTSVLDCHDGPMR